MREVIKPTSGLSLPDVTSSCRKGDFASKVAEEGARGGAVSSRSLGNELSEVAMAAMGKVAKRKPKSEDYRLPQELEGLDKGLVQRLKVKFYTKVKT